MYLDCFYDSVMTERPYLSRRWQQQKFVLPSDTAKFYLFINAVLIQECQRRLQHPLPLRAYLLKPVQRITKYKLLLKVRTTIRLLARNVASATFATRMSVRPSITLVINA